MNSSDQFAGNSDRVVFVDTRPIWMWTGFWVSVSGCCLIGVLQPHADWVFEDWAFVSVVFFGVTGIWVIGFVALRRNQYFISKTSFGFRDVFKTCEIRFDDVVQVIVRYRRGVVAQVVANGQTTYLRVDWTTNGEWWKAVRMRLKPKLGQNWQAYDLLGLPIKEPE